MTRRTDSWQSKFLLVPPRAVRAVSAGAGLVVSGGDALHMLRPGAQSIRFRELPKLIGPAVAVTAEPWSPRRFAMASSGRLAVFEGQEPDEPFFEIGFTTPDRHVTHLAWTRDRGVSTIYFRDVGGRLGRIRIDAQEYEYCEAPSMAAIASDSEGSLALMSLVPGEEDVWVSQPDGGYEVRPMTTIPVGESGEDLQIFFAVSGAAVAYSLDGAWGTHVSWGRDEPFELCKGMLGGAVAFHGDDALLGAYCVETTASIFHLPRGGEPTRIVEIVSEGPGEELMPTLSSLAWDASRRALFAASPELGLVMSTPPEAKGQPAPLLS